ncbi:putative helicase mug81 [Metarhizium anisopliae]
MASPDLVAAEAEWREQFAAMQTALANLKLPTLSKAEESYPDDDDDLEGFSSGNEGHDVWDFISDTEQDEYSSDHVDVDVDGVGAAEPESALHWFLDASAGIAANNNLSPDVFQNQIMSVLSSSGEPDYELQSHLTDLVGFDHLDFVIDVLSKKDVLVAGSQGRDEKHPTSRRLLNKSEREAALRRQDFEHKTASLSPASKKEPHYPHVYRSYQAGNTLSFAGKKYGLPVGSERRQFEKYEEYFVPAGRKGTLGPGEKLVAISDLDGLCRNTFKGYKTLNRMQSLVFPVGYKTNENMLICAPTGAGKTDAAMLTILHTIGQHVYPNPIENPEATEFAVDIDDFKIVYVAPMKALAAEVTEKLGKRLAWLGIKCREYTGDMQLTKSEIVQTQIIVTTPEKWDVVTRKGTGDTELVQKVRLLIIDEVHMLHDERGAVLESLVARTERQVESTQSLIRVIGLSATLPNYVDVADFLKVNKYAGLFYFDASFRPVPLEQHFIGVKGKAGSKQSKENLDNIAFEKVKEMLERDHQVMVFVHSRRDTMVTARMLHQKAIEQFCMDLFDPSGHPKYDQASRDMKSSRAKDIRDLLSKGIGIHHAGMARADRNLMERLFGEGVLKVLCCTATLAWGVNLPAAAVVIKGTQVYSAQDGKFVDLGILDVLQIFGRAGRPQFEDTGIGMICTTQDKLPHYLTAITEQQPIESKFSTKLVDNLNAEIALGTVTSIQDAVQWIGYSYLFVRMQRSPTAYGIEWAEIRDDPTLVQRRRQLAIQAARTLQQCQMIIFNERTEELRSKDIGRIASQYYILHTSIQVFNTMMQPQATEADILKMISMSGEFDNVQSRDTEAKELTHLKNDVVPCDVDGGIDTPQSKTNILLQSYISRQQPEDFALSNDMNYVAQQSGRICRALFMLALNRRWGHQCLVLLTLSKSIEKRIWPFQHPLHQFDLPKPVLNQLDAKENLTMETMKEMEPAEIGGLVHNHSAGKTISRFLNHFPTVHVEAEIAPLNRDVLRIKLYVIPDFSWKDQIHGTSESFYIWVENSDTSEIYHHEFFILNRRKLHDEHELNFTIPLSDPLPTQIYVRAVSDRWLGAETVTPVSFQHLIRPDTESVYTDLLNLQPLPISALKNPGLEEIYAQRFQFFNPMQTQIFHTLYHTPANVLLGSPTGSGKTVAAELAMWWAFRERPKSKVVYIAPMKALVRERVKDWGKRLAQPLGLKIVELTGDNTPDTRTIKDADIIITTPEKWDGISRSWQTRGYVRQVSLVIIDEIHLLAGDRGPILEIIVSRMNYISSSTKNKVRLLGMSTACANATDLGSWLGVKEGLFNFKHSVRPVPLELYIDGFPEIRGFCPLMQSMNRPTFLAIKNHSPDKPVIVFVASRRQTRLTAKDLINFCGMEDNPRRDMDLTDVLQMLGRAGRPQFDNSGVARIFTQDSKKDFYKHFLHTGFPVESSLHSVLDNHLCAEVSAETIVTKQDALDYLTWTFFFRRLHKNPSYYGLELSAEEHSTIAAQQLANEYMIEMVNKSLGELAESKCVEVFPNGDVDPTALGKIMSYYYLSHKTIRHLVKHAKAQASFLDVLSWMSRAIEYDELPVRHNEDLINDTLSANLPYPGHAFGLPMWDPHVKAFLLLQAHMSRIELPITDYVGDQTSVLDQAIRIVQASIDVLTELGYLSSCLQMISLLQCIKSARWPTDPVVSILPGVEPESTKDNTPLSKLSVLKPNEVNQLSKKLGLKSAQQLSRVARAVSFLPNVSISTSDVTALSVTVNIKRINAPVDREARIYAPKFPKPQTEGWFVLVGDITRDEVIAVKRATWAAPGAKSLGQSSTPSVKTVIKLPEAVGGQARKVDILVVSDGYVGLEYKIEGVDIPGVPMVDDAIGSKKGNA